MKLRRLPILMFVVLIFQGYSLSDFIIEGLKGLSPPRVSAATTVSPT